MKKLILLTLALALPFAVNAEVPKEVRDYVDLTIDEKLNDALPSNTKFIGVDKTEYVMLTDRYVVVSASIAGIKPYASGSEITLEIINWMGITITGANFRVVIAHTKTGKPHFAKNGINVPELKPGKAKHATVRISEKPEEFDTVGIVFLGADGISYSSAK